MTMLTLNKNRPNGSRLGESHIRHIRAILLILDARLDEMERWTSWPLPSGPLYRWVRDMEPESLARVHHEVLRLRRDLTAIVEAIGLAPECKSASGSMQTSAIFSLIDLQNLEPRRLKEYGPLPEDQTARLEDFCNSLRGPLETIRSQCGRSNSGPPLDKPEDGP